MMRQLFLFLGLLPLLIRAVSLPSGGFPQDEGLLDLQGLLSVSDEEADLMESRYNISDAAPEPARSLEKRDTLTVSVYNLKIDGRGVGNVRNWGPVNGLLYVFSRVNSPGTRNGNNAADFIFAAGSDPTIGVAGNCRYYTNRLLYRVANARWAASKLDYSTVVRSGNTYTIRPDYYLAASNSLAAFNQNTGVTASIFLIDSGYLQVTLLSNGARVSGTVAFNGRGYIFPDTRGWYRGKITGTRNPNFVNKRVTL
ncbi:hypothetical protein ABW20_dc0106925 [Dactylellina cionopaga]|nr:hypothetical protein ABW20_dc0106925 [Dactylellina cionopaga]